jgi:UDP-N-acetylglucosamine 2-epimerase (non-hydrolysing)
MKKISVIFGTRPEAIKLAPVILELKRHPELKCEVCITAQHREMLDQVLEIFQIIPDFDLNLMAPNQGLAEFASKAIDRLNVYMQKNQPDLVLVQGDTTTVFAASLAAFYNKIPVGHVEAGLRSGNRYAPFPEEINRVLTSRLTSIHFCPTDGNKQNLLGEGIDEKTI